MFRFLKNIVVNLPARKSLRIYWNFGSMLGMVLCVQVFSGLFMAFYYCADSGLSFDSVQHIIYNCNNGFFLRIIHINFASLFFICLYIHFFKGLFMSSYRLSGTWCTGLMILLVVIGVSFIGYVLVWAQMSFWAAVVITSLLSVIPYFGDQLVYWIWGGFSVSGSTLKFLFVLHFLVPWVIFLLVLCHLLFLHKTGSTSSIYCHGDYDKICFYPYYWAKDFYNVVFIVFLVFFILVFPYFFRDPEIYINADPITSPVHIVPEWYFLFAYAILRAIPNKVLGVVALLSSIVVFFFFSLIGNYTSVLSNLNKFLVFIFFFICVFLSWLGQCGVEYPFDYLSVVFTCLYFFLVFVLFFCNWFSFYVFK